MKIKNELVICERVGKHRKCLWCAYGMMHEKTKECDKPKYCGCIRRKVKCVKWVWER